MNFHFNDGGRTSSGYKGETGDCVVRAIAIAAELPYQQVYEAANKLSARERGKSRSNARSGVRRTAIRRLMQSLGWDWTPTMHIGSGCKVHMRQEELPRGRIVVALSRHIAAVIDGVLHDTHDCSRDGNRCVYGYWSKP